MTFTHICKSGNDFIATIPDVVVPGLFAHDVQWEKRPSKKDIRECEEVILLRLNGRAGSSVTTVGVVSL